MEELIRKVIETLDGVEVKGRSNLNKMLGCMQTLDRIAEAMRHNREAMASVSAAEEATKEGVKNDEQ